MKMDPLADLYRRKLHFPNAIFTYIDHEDAMVAAVFKISQPESPDLIKNGFMELVFKTP